MSILRGQQEIADYLGITARTLRTWLEGPERPPVSRRRGVHFASPRELDDWALSSATPENSGKDRKIAEKTGS